MLGSGHATSLLRWRRHLPQLREVLQKAEFVSLDLEMTGLHARSEKFLGVDRCYVAHAAGARGFMPVQLGLCAARRSDSDPNRWILTPASIYLIPREPRVFQATTSTLKFLHDNAFDFNEWISRGVPYTRRQEENNESTALMRRMEELRNLQTRASSETTSSLSGGEPVTASLFEAATDEDRLLAASVRQDITDWLQAGPHEPLERPVDSPLQRLMLHSLVAAEFPQLFSSSSRRGQQRIFAVYATESQVFEEQLRKLQGELSDAKEARGARELLEDIWKERLLVVGHCCFYDFLHLYQSFVEDLPGDVADFKNKWSQLFPSTFDTKLLAETHEALAPLGAPATLKGLCELMVATSVGGLPEGSQERRLRFEVEPLEGTTWRLDSCLAPLIINGGTTQALPGREDASQNRILYEGRCGTAADVGGEAPPGESYSAHDAGYDSLMTSMVFLLQLEHVMQQKGLTWEDVYFRTPAGGAPSKSEARSSLSVQDMLSQFVSRVRLVRTQPPYMSLGGEDDHRQQQQSRLLVMRNFPSTWQKWNIMKLWSPIWVDVQPVDSCTCWLVTRSEADARSLLTIYEMMPSKTFELMTYEDYKAQQAHQDYKVVENPERL